MKIKYADKNRIKIKIKLSIKIIINKINNKITINKKERETIITKQTLKHEQTLSTNKI